MIFLVSAISLVALVAIVLVANKLALSFDLDEESLEEWETFKSAFGGKK